MESQAIKRPHVVCIPFPAQGHIYPLLNLAKLLHHKGFHITFVNTEFYHQRLLIKSRGPKSVEGLPDFQFRTIPDGLQPPSNPCNQTPYLPALCTSIKKNCLVPFLDLIKALNASPNTPRVSYILSDGVMSFTLKAAQELSIPEMVFFTTSACGFMGNVHYAELLNRGYVPFKDESFPTNGYLDTQIDWIPGMRGIRLRDLPSFIRITDPDDIVFNDSIEHITNASKARGLILNTMDDLEHQVLEAIRSKFPQVYTVGPLQLLQRNIPKGELDSISTTLWKEEMECLQWLDQREPNSVVYISFGSIKFLTAPQLSELAWGLANSGQSFLWIIRPDQLNGENASLPDGFVDETRGRGMIAGWCPQEQVLSHPSVGGFLTHCGWNSTIESISEGVPMICWPFSAEQPTNCRYACTDWAIGVEVDSNVKRETVERLVRELMQEEKGREMRKMALEWKKKAQLATKPGGSSYMNLERLVEDMLLQIKG